MTFQFKKNMLSFNKNKGDKQMPDYILLDDMIDDMIDNISYIKLNSYLNLDKDN